MSMHLFVIQHGFILKFVEFMKKQIKPLALVDCFVRVIRFCCHDH